MKKIIIMINRRFKGKGLFLPFYLFAFSSLRQDGKS